MKHKQLLRERGGRAVCQRWGGRDIPLNGTCAEVRSMPLLGVNTRQFLLVLIYLFFRAGPLGRRGAERSVCPSAVAQCFFFFTLVTGPRRSLSLDLSDTRVYEPPIRARLGTAARFCKVVVLMVSFGIDVEA